MSGDTSMNRKQTKASITVMIADAAEISGYAVHFRYREAVVLRDAKDDLYMVTVTGMRDKKVTP